MENQERILDISWGTILKVFIAGICFYILYLIRDLLIWFLFAVMISILLGPAIKFLEEKRVPRVLAVVFIYLSIFGFLATLIYLAATPLISEVRYFVDNFPQYFEKFSPPLRILGLEAFENLETFIAAFEKMLGRMSSDIFGALFSFFGGVFSTVFVIMVAVFISLENNSVEKAIALISPKKYEAYVLSLWNKCQRNVSGWFATRILGCFFVGLVSYAAFLILNVRCPVSLALIAGILEFIPIIGPLITGIIAFAVVSLTSFSQAMFVLIFFIILQQIEGNVLTPIIVQRFITLPPSLVLISLAIGGVLYGILGAIFFVPLAGILYEFFRDFLKKRKERDMVML